MTGPPVENPINLTDEATRVMLGVQGFLQGYKALAAVEVDTMRVLAAKVTPAPNGEQQI